MKVAESWAYQGGDGCADFFGLCLKEANPDIPANAHVLEIGCSEFDWLTPATWCWPEMTLIGIDTRNGGDNARGPRAVAVNADVMKSELFAPASFDWIVSISAIEHVGLGHYGDPVDPDGDIKAITNAFRWLKPGGWLLFDVPYNREGYQVLNTECRVYDDDALWTRLWQEPLAGAKAMARWHGTYYVDAKATSTLLEKPTTATTPFHYVGLAWQKVG